MLCASALCNKFQGRCVLDKQPPFSFQNLCLDSCCPLCCGGMYPSRLLLCSTAASPEHGSTQLEDPPNFARFEGSTPAGSKEIRMEHARAGY